MSNNASPSLPVKKPLATAELPAASDRERYGEWVEAYSESLFRFAYRLTSDRMVAEDLVQETYEQAWRNVLRWGAPRNPQAWLFRVLRRRYARWLKKHKQRGEVHWSHDDGESSEVDLVIDPEESPESRLMRDDQLQVALALLDDRFKQPLLLVVMEEVPVATVAKILRLPRGTVLSRVARAKRKLAELMQQQPYENDS